MFVTVSIKKFGGNELALAGAVKEDLACSGSSPLNKSDQVISSRNAATAAGRRAPGPAIWFFQDHKWKQRHNPSYKRQATSTKHHAPVFRKQQASIKLQATSVKLSNQPVQSPSDKHPILNNKRQASSPE